MDDAETALSSMLLSYTPATVAALTAFLKHFQDKGIGGEHFVVATDSRTGAKHFRVRLTDAVAWDFVSTAAQQNFYVNLFFDRAEEGTLDMHVSVAAHDSAPVGGEEADAMEAPISMALGSVIMGEVHKVDAWRSPMLKKRLTTLIERLAGAEVLRAAQLTISVHLGGAQVQFGNATHVTDALLDDIVATIVAGRDDPGGKLTNKVRAGVVLHASRAIDRHRWTSFVRVLEGDAPATRTVAGADGDWGEGGLCIDVDLDVELTEDELDDSKSDDDDDDGRAASGKRCKT